MVQVSGRYCYRVGVGDILSSFVFSSSVEIMTGVGAFPEEGLTLPTLDEIMRGKDRLF